MLQEALGGRQLKTTKTNDKMKKNGCPTELQYRMVPQGPNPGCPEQASQQQMNHQNLLMILIIWGMTVCVAIKGKAKAAIYSCCKNYIVGQITIDTSRMGLTKGAVIMIWRTLDVPAVLYKDALEGDNCHLQGSTGCWPASLSSDQI